MSFSTIPNNRNISFGISAKAKTTSWWPISHYFQELHGVMWIGLLLYPNEIDSVLLMINIRKNYVGMIVKPETFPLRILKLLMMVS
jgi:hypothetical protein